MDQIEQAEYSVEDRLCFAARVSSASLPICALMEEASEEITHLRKELAMARS